MRTKVLSVLRSEQISDNLTVFVEETEKSYLLKIKYENKIFTIDRFGKKEESSKENVLFYFRKVAGKLKESMKGKSDLLAIIEFLP